MSICDHCGAAYVSLGPPYKGIGLCEFCITKLLVSDAALKQFRKSRLPEGNTASWKRGIWA